MRNLKKLKIETFEKMVRNMIAEELKAHKENGVKFITSPGFGSGKIDDAIDYINGGLSHSFTFIAFTYSIVKGETK